MDLPFSTKGTTCSGRCRVCPASRFKGWELTSHIDISPKAIFRKHFPLRSLHRHIHDCTEFSVVYVVPWLLQKKTVRQEALNPLQNVDGLMYIGHTASPLVPINFSAKVLFQTQPKRHKAPCTCISAKKRSESLKTYMFCFFCCTLDLCYTYIYMYTVHHLIFKHG